MSNINKKRIIRNMKRNVVLILLSALLLIFAAGCTDDIKPSTDNMPETSGTAVQAGSQAVPGVSSKPADDGQLTEAGDQTQSQGQASLEPSAAAQTPSGGGADAQSGDKNSVGNDPDKQTDNSSPEGSQPVSPSPSTTETGAGQGSGDSGQTPEPEETDNSEIPPEEAVTIKVVGPDDLLLFEVALDPIDIATAFDALKSACEAEGITLKYSGSGGFTYIQAIGNYTERSEGPLSGWIFKVNGEQPNKSCSSVDVKKGDRVSFYFTLDLGKDVADKD